MENLLWETGYVHAKTGNQKQHHRKRLEGGYRWKPLKKMKFKRENPTKDEKIKEFMQVVICHMIYKEIAIEPGKILLNSMIVYW